MPFRWKKAKGSRFSQLVADHFHTSKHGGSLVLQTGFPTSLVDLFVKNRDRMYKSHKNTGSPVDDSPPSNLPHSNYPSHSPKIPDTDSTMVEEIDEKHYSNPISPSHSVGGGRSVHPVDREIVEMDAPIPVVSSVGVGGGHLPVSTATNYPIDGEIIEGVNLIPVFGGSGGVVRLLMWLLKISVAVGLALGTKRFVIGITVSAFFLFLLELVGNHLFGNRRFRQHKNLESVVQRDPLLDVIKPNDQLITGSGEIQIAEIEFNSERTMSSGVSFDAGDCIERFVFEDYMESKKMDLEKEERQRCDVPVGVKHRHSRRAKMKSQMKKLVSKKLRKSKDSCSNSGSEVSGSLQDNDTVEEQEQSKIMELSCQEEEQAAALYKESWKIELKAMPIAVLERMGSRPSERGSGYLVLCLIVLIGLVGGRMVALVLALSWCLMLKILSRRSGKVAVVGSSAIISG